jgi:hypothetical protein
VRLSALASALLTRVDHMSGATREILGITAQRQQSGPRRDR